MPRPVLARLESLAFGLLGRTLAARALDSTDELTSRDTLVIAPHPDDETLGCGGTIARLAGRGRAVHVAVVADGRHSHSSDRITPDQLAAVRRQEVAEACRRLGIPAERLHWLGFEDRHIARDAAAVRERLATLIRRLGPAQVLSATGIDRSSDHQALAEVVAALRDGGTIRVPLYEYPVWFYSARTWLSPRRGPLPPIRGLLWRPALAALTLPAVKVSTAGQLDRKRHALEAFASQMTRYTGEPGWATMSPLFLRHFFRAHELFLTPSRAVERTARAVREVPPTAPPAAPPSAPRTAPPAAHPSPPAAHPSAPAPRPAPEPGHA